MSLDCQKSWCHNGLKVIMNEHYNFDTSAFSEDFSNLSTKAVTKWEGPKIFLAAPKPVYFFTAGSWEKDTIFGAARKNFGDSYFVTALHYNAVHGFSKKHQKILLANVQCQHQNSIIYSVFMFLLRDLFILFELWLKTVK